MLNQESAGRPVRGVTRHSIPGTTIAAAALAFGLFGASQVSHAATIVLDVTGGTGLEQGDLCATTTGFTCPTDPTLTLSGTATASGNFTINTSTDVASFSLTLTKNASFGGETLMAGSTVFASGVPVTASALTATEEQYTQSGSPLQGTASLSFNPTLATIQGTPSISALSCTTGTKTDICAVSLGAGGLEVGPDGNKIDYNGFLTFSVDTVPVPLPASGWLLLIGVGACLMLVRRAPARPRSIS